MRGVGEQLGNPDDHSSSGVAALSGGAVEDHRSHADAVIVASGCVVERSLGRLLVCLALSTVRARIPGGWTWA